MSGAIDVAIGLVCFAVGYGVSHILGRKRTVSNNSASMIAPAPTHVTVIEDRGGGKLDTTDNKLITPVNEAATPSLVPILNVSIDPASNGQQGQPGTSLYRTFSAPGTANTRYSNMKTSLKKTSLKKSYSSVPAETTSLALTTSSAKFRGVDILTPIETCVKLLEQMKTEHKMSVETCETLDECIGLLRDGGYEEGLVLQHNDLQELDDSVIGEADFDFLNSVEMGRKQRRNSIAHDGDNPMSIPTIASRLKAIEGRSVALNKAKSMRNSMGVSSSNLTTSPRSPTANINVEGFEQWDFNIFEYHQKNSVPGTTLSVIMNYCFQKFGLFDVLYLNKEKFSIYMMELERNYCISPDIPNSYHHSLHAADVVHAVYYFAHNSNVSTCLNVNHLLSLFFAAAIHDFRHPGVSNKYIRNTKNIIGLIHSDDSALERFHLGEAFSMLVLDDLNFMAPPESLDESLRHKVVPWDEMRDCVIQGVLATDLALGPTYTSRFRLKLETGFKNDTVLLIQMLLKAADLSHPSKPFVIHNTWTKMIMEEFFMQGDAEKECGMTVSPLCDREKDSSIAINQKGFIDFVVRPVYEPLMILLKDEIPLNHLKANYQNWHNIAVETTRHSDNLRTESKSGTESVQPGVTFIALGDKKISEPAGDADPSAPPTMKRRFSLVVLADAANTNNNATNNLSYNKIPDASSGNSAARTLEKKLSGASVLIRRYTNQSVPMDVNGVSSKSLYTSASNLRMLPSKTSIPQRPSSLSIYAESDISTDT